MDRIMIFRRMPGKTPRKGAKGIIDALKRINHTARVKRDEVVHFFLSGEFGKLPITPQSVIDSPIRREAAIGFEVPEGCLGRKGIATPEQAESVRLWIKKNLSPEGINPDTVSVVFVRAERD